MTPDEAVAVRNMADHAEGVRRLCQLVATALHNDPSPVGVADAIEALGWMVGEISESLARAADPTA
ncbi:hypothetical protein [Sphingomonas sp.]|uniref:hypothetical protein n=1 Tax=Sphingomonas sp. TaxID=28214 RepID=UPI00257F82FA|nr:hypothetical protein [Sphingomonas sp.]